jgi:hypothetical protein
MEFITHTQALELKQLGFDELCWAWYNMPDEDVRYCFSEQRSPITNSHEEWSAQIWGNQVENIGLPTFSQCFKWFREKHQLNGELYSQLRPSNKFMYGFKIGGSDIIYDGFHTYEEAEDACLDRLIQIAKNKP